MLIQERYFEYKDQLTFKSVSTHVDPPLSLETKLNKFFFLHAKYLTQRLGSLLSSQIHKAFINRAFGFSQGKMVNRLVRATLDVFENR